MAPGHEGRRRMCVSHPEAVLSPVTLAFHSPAWLRSTKMDEPALTAELSPVIELVDANR